MANEDQVDSEIGEALADMLGLKVRKDGRIATSWGHEDLHRSDP